MSSILTASPAAPAKPRGLSRAEKEQKAAEQFSAGVAARHDLERAQRRNAVRVKLEKLARREPAIAQLLQENVALQASIKVLQQKNAALLDELTQAKTQRTAAEQSHAGTSANLETAHRELAAAREELGALASARARIVELEGNAAHLGRDLDAARAEAAKARKDLEAALKSKGK